MEYKKPTFADLLNNQEMSDLITSQIKEAKDLNDEIFSVRSYLLDRYGPFSKSKILTGEESSKAMVDTVIGRKDKEIEKLMRLLEEEVKHRADVLWDSQDCGYLQNITLKDHREQRWQSYCKEHDIKKPT